MKRLSRKVITIKIIEVKMKFQSANQFSVESTLVTHSMNYFVLKVFSPQETDWDAYAKQYNAVTRDLKPSYQEIISLPFQFKEINKAISTCRLAYDVGAGTGNLSIQLARSNKNMKVAHIDYGMEFVEIAKQESSDIENIDFHLEDAGNLKKLNQYYQSSPNLIFMTHSLYAMENPQYILSSIYESLVDGGLFWIADINREMNLGHLIYDGIKNARKKFGSLKKTFAYFKEMDQAKHQNANIIRNQRSGKYLTCRLSHLIDMVCKAGFNKENILFSSEFEYYDNYDNVILVRK